MRKRTPQEKKVLSYAKDGRNAYGESDKGSRKAIRRNKTFPNRAFRREINQVLQDVNGEIDLENAELINNEAKTIRRRKWKKFPDLPLGKFVKLQLEKREDRFGGKLRRKLRREE